MRIILLIFLSVLSLSLFSQITEGEDILRKDNTDTLQGWTSGGLINTAFAQTGLTNWAAGGENSLAGNGLASLFLNYKNNSSALDNTLDLGYGLLKQGNNQHARKSDDKLELTSKYGLKASNNWFYATLLNIRSQFSPGYNYPDDTTKISDFLSPCYLLGAVGMDYKPGPRFTAFIAPVTIKTTIVNSTLLADAGSFGVVPAIFDENGKIIKHGKMFRNELGGYYRMAINWKLMENITLNSKIDFFSNYLKKPGNIDVNWETLIGMKINKYIAASISTHLIYDDDIDIAVDTDNDGIADKTGPRTQFKEVIGVGFSYIF